MSAFGLHQGPGITRYSPCSRLTVFAEVPLRFNGGADKDKKVLAEELWYDWIYMNVLPVYVSNIIKKLDQLFTRSNEYFKVSSRVEPSKVLNISSKINKSSKRYGKPVRNSLKDIDSEILSMLNGGKWCHC